MSERFVIVHRTYDPLQADLLGDVLRDVGLCARVTGTRSAALIGVAQNILELHVAVPESEAGQATDFLESYFASGVDSGDEAGADSGEDEAEAEMEEEAGADGEVAGARPIRPLLAAGSAFLTFGVGHLYSRRPATALALLVGQVVAMVYLFAGRSWYAWTVGLIALGAIVACDLVGSMLAARAHRIGVRRGRTWQAAVGAAYVCGALFTAHATVPLLTDPKAGNPTGGGRAMERLHANPIEKMDKPLDRDPSFPPLMSQHPANPSARH